MHVEHGGAVAAWAARRQAAQEQVQPLMRAGNAKMLLTRVKPGYGLWCHQDPSLRRGWEITSEPKHCCRRHSLRARPKYRMVANAGNLSFRCVAVTKGPSDAISPKPGFWRKNWR